MRYPCRSEPPPAASDPERRPRPVRWALASAAVALLIAAGILVQRALAAPPHCTSRAAVLEYHEVGPNPTRDKYIVNVGDFTAQIRVLRSAQVTTLTVPQLVRDMQQRCFPPRAVAITFDDGYEGVYTNAFPVLQRNDMAATAFIIGYDASVLAPTEPAGGAAPRHLGWSQIQALARGGWSIESHTYDLHGTDGELLERATPERLAQDLVTEDRLLAAEVGEAPVAFAYPGGHAPSWALPVLRARYQAAFIEGARPVRFTDDPLLLPRYMVADSTNIGYLLRTALGIHWW